MPNSRFQIRIEGQDATAAAVNKTKARFRGLAEPIERIGKLSKGFERKGFDGLTKSLGEVIKFGGGAAAELEGASGAALGLGGSLGLAGGVATAFGIAMAIGAKKVMDFASAEADAIDNLATQASLMGLNARELEKWRGAAGYSAIAAEQLDGAMAGVGKTMNDAVNGRNMQALILMDRFHIRLKRNKDGSVDTAAAMLDLADAVAKVKGAQSKALLADVFGAGAVLPMLMKGRREMLADMGRFQGARGQLVSPADIEQAETFKRSLEDVRNRWDGLKAAFSRKVGMPTASWFLDIAKRWTGVTAHDFNTRGALGLLDSTIIGSAILGLTEAKQKQAAVTGQTVGWADALGRVRVEGARAGVAFGRMAPAARLVSEQVLDAIRRPWAEARGVARGYVAVAGLELRRLGGWLNRQAEDGGRFGDGVANGVRRAWREVQAFGGLVSQSVRGDLTRLHDVVVGSWSETARGLQGAWSNVEAFFDGLWRGVLSRIKGAWDQVKDYFGQLWQGIAGRFQAGVDAVQAQIERARRLPSAIEEGARNGVARAGRAAGRAASDIGVAASEAARAARYSQLGKDIDGALDGFVRRLRHQESRGRQFDHSGNALISPKGAVGAMQLMPDTARLAARRLGVAFSEARLRTDRAYNEMLGKAHAKYLLGRYGGNQVLAAAAYNAGEGHVDGWIRRFGDPRRGDVSSADFARDIPFRETRDYVDRTVIHPQADADRGPDPAAPGPWGQFDPTTRERVSRDDILAALAAPRGQPAAPPVQPAPGQDAGAGNSRLEVVFRNTPPGTRVEASSAPRQALDVRVEHAMGH